MSSLLRSTRLVVQNKNSFKNLACSLSTNNIINNKRLFQINQSFNQQRSIATKTILSNSLLAKTLNVNLFWEFRLFF